MRKRRRSAQPATPDSLLQYGAMLHNDNGRFSKTLGGQQFFHSIINSTDGTSILFGSPTFLEEVHNSREFHVDGTFKVLPRAPPCLQLITVMSVHYNHVSIVFYNIFRLKVMSKSFHLTKLS